MLKLPPPLKLHCSLIFTIISYSHIVLLKSIHSNVSGCMQIDKSWHYILSAALDPCVVNQLPLSFNLTFHLYIFQHYDSDRQAEAAQHTIHLLHTIQVCYKHTFNTLILLVIILTDYNRVLCLNYLCNYLLIKIANQKTIRSSNYHHHAWLARCSYQNPPLCCSISEVRWGVGLYIFRTGNDLRGSEGYQELAW